MRFGLFSKLILAFIILVTLSIFLPISEIANTDALLASATFLYGVLYGFEISIVLGNFSKLKSLLATENAGLASIFHLIQLIGGQFAKQVEGKIEKYLRKAIDVPLSNYLMDTNKEFFEIFEPLKTVKVNGDEQTAALNYINEGLYYIPQSRTQIAQVAPRDVDPPEWAMLLILAFILVATLLLGREANLVSQLSAAIFATTVVGSLLLLDEVDSNRIQEARLEYEVFNETLTAMGKDKYYPETALKTGIVKLSKS